MYSYLKSQAKILNKHKITLVSINLEVDKKDNRYTKKMLGRPPKYANITLVTEYAPKKNSMIIPTGPRYNNLICIDVDNKNNTITYFEKLCKTSNCNLNTLTVKTINNGYHYYFVLSEEQNNVLKNFNASVES